MLTFIYLFILLISVLLKMSVPQRRHLFVILQELPLMLSSHWRFLLLHPHMLFVGVSQCQSLLPQRLFANRLLLFSLFSCVSLLVCCVSFTYVFWGLSCACVMSTPSSDSSDSRLPIIRRDEGSMEETYDESFADEREYQDDNHSLSSDMYCTITPGRMFIGICLNTIDELLFEYSLGWCIMMRHVNS